MVPALICLWPKHKVAAAAGNFTLTKSMEAEEMIASTINRKGLSRAH